MLRMYVYGDHETARDVVPSNMEIVTDVEAEFGAMGFEMTDTAKKIVKDVDEGELLSTEIFNDRLGRGLFTDCLSTGSKAGLLVSSCDKVIDLIECGINAISSIFIHCQSGNVALRNPMQDLIGDSDTPVDIIIADDKEVHLTTIKEVNEYFFRGKAIQGVS